MGFRASYSHFSPYFLNVFDLIFISTHPHWRYYDSTYGIFTLSRVFSRFYFPASAVEKRLRRRVFVSNYHKLRAPFSQKNKKFIKIVILNKYRKIVKFSFYDLKCGSVFSTHSFILFYFSSQKSVPSLPIIGYVSQNSAEWLRLVFLFYLHIHMN